MKQQRRIFLKVLAAGPLVGCAGSGPEGSSPEGDGGSPEGDAGGGVGSSPPSNGGAGQTGGSFLSNSGNGPGSGGFFGSTAGRSTGGASSGAPGTGAGGGTTLPGAFIGNVSDFPMGSFSIAAGLFFLGHDAQGIYVMSMQCTHKGCAVAMAGQALQCPCHEARFDRTGNVLGGPAPAPLPHFAVYVDAAGNISVDRFTVVSSSTRTPV